MQNNKPKIIFFGTPGFAAGILEALIENKFDVAAVVTQPDKKIGRKQKIEPSVVKKNALEINIKVFQPDSLKSKEIVEELKKIKPDLFVVAAYGKILPKVMLEIPRYGAINIHASLLPKYRGASPVQCAILEGEKKTGITLMRMNEKMDEGDILAQEKIKIGENETADELLSKLGALGARMIVKFVPIWTPGKTKSRPQDHVRATYCGSIKREDGKIDWNSSAEEIYRQWRAYHPWPGIFALYKIKNQPRRLKLPEIRIVPAVETGEKSGKVVRYNQEIAVQTGKGLVVLKKVQMEGKKEMDVYEFVKGNPGFAGSELT